ncbi:MAG: DUF3429 domain-containing protein [Gammaproteobacteria bacterium]|nr:DUF3429 domain-containing protein [Gammaproteobacteria bacterium]
MQKIHYILGYSGLIPFIGLAMLQIAGWPMAQFVLIGYSTLIISFLAGTLWAASIYYSLNWQVALVSNLIMLAAWIILLLHESTAILIWAAILLALQLFYESWKLKPLYPARLIKMRYVLTFGASCSIVFAALFS